MNDEEAQDHAETGEAKQEGVDVGYGKMKVHVAEKQLPLVGVFFTAMVLLISVCTLANRFGKGYKNWAYGISLASIAMGFSLIGLLLTMKEELNAKFGKFIAWFLFIWCFIGTCILTFQGPFTSTGNGYFAAWSMTIFSVQGMGVSGDSLKSSARSIGSMLGLVVSSIIVICAIPQYVKGDFRNQSIYALVLACLTVAVVGAFILMEQRSERQSKVTFPVMAIFAILWIVCACLVTFQGPFLVTGNGYFAAWGGAVTSVFAAMATLAAWKN